MLYQENYDNKANNYDLFKYFFEVIIKISSLVNLPKVEGLPSWIQVVYTNSKHYNPYYSVYRLLHMHHNVKFPTCGHKLFLYKGDKLASHIDVSIKPKPRKSRPHANPIASLHNAHN